MLWLLCGRASRAATFGLTHSVPCVQAIFEYEGVVLADTSDLHSKAWEQLAAEEGKARPLQWALRRAQGMKDEQARARPVVCWTGCAVACSR